MNTITLKVKGMKCGGCSNNIEQALKADTGVSSVKANHVEGTVDIEFDEQKTELPKLKQIIVSKGFSLA